MNPFSTAFRPILFLASIASGLSAEQADSPVPPQAPINLVERFDQNGDHRLDAKERQNAREYLAKQAPQNPPGTQGRPGLVLQNGPVEPTKPGEKINLATAVLFPDRGLYDTDVLRTVSLAFEDSAWQKELTDFAGTDVLVPATLMIDGKSYPGVGVRLRDREAGNEIDEGYKRAMEIVVNYTAPDQNVYGHKCLALLDVSSDATLQRSVLYSHVAQKFIRAPKANFVRVAINGENWGIYVSAEPVDETFISENFPDKKGTWWTVYPGGNLAYLGANPDAYRKSYHLQSAENPEAWNALIDLCKALDQTRAADLESELSKRIDIENTLKFLALENALINQDGYGGKEGSYGLYRGADGRFLFIPQDAEASFRLLEYSEVDKQPPQRRTPESHASKKGDAPDPQTPPGAAGGHTKKEFPKQAATDLSMLLSYSFVNKADTDFDSKLSREEWLAFARSWFVVMDEDLIGKLNQDQFIEKFRIIVTPASGIDGHTKQSFGKDDPAGMIGRDFFKAMDQNRDGFLTSDEIIATFTQWFPEWASGKPAVITQPALQKGFSTLFSRTTFQADQSLIVSRKASDHIEGDHEFGGRHGGRGSGAGGSFGPLRFFSRNRGNRASSTLVTYSAELYPLAGLDEADKPLLEKLLLVPAFRQQYLGYVKDIAENWLDWNKLGPIAKQYRDLIADDVQKETHKANSYEHFVQEFDQDTSDGQRDGEPAPSLKNFAGERRKFLLKDDDVSGASGGN